MKFNSGADELFSAYYRLKQDTGCRFFDVHTHPEEVLGCQLHEEGGNVSFVKEPSLLEKMDFNTLARLVLRFLFKYAPSYIKSEIQKRFSKTDKNRLLSEMKKAGIDMGVIVPVEPFVSLDKIREKYKDGHFMFLGSIDIKNISVGNLESEIKRQMDLGIVGLKLHPNIQGFYPEPSLNDEETARKLLLLYQLISKLSLFVLIHAGISYLPDNNNFKLVEFGRLEKFFKLDGSSSFFDTIKTPIILAHMASYNISQVNYKLIDIIYYKYSNVYFDTAGVSSHVIGTHIERYGSKKVLFGSDSLYFSMLHGVELVLKGIKQSTDDSVFEETVLDIFGKNFSSNFLKK